MEEWKPNKNSKASEDRTFPKAPKKSTKVFSTAMQQTWAVSHQGNKATFEHRNCGRFFQNELWLNWDVSQLANYGHVMTKIIIMSSEVSSLHPAGLIIWQYRGKLLGASMDLRLRGWFSSLRELLGLWWIWMVFMVDTGVYQPWWWSAKLLWVPTLLFQISDFRRWQRLGLVSLWFQGWQSQWLPRGWKTVVKFGSYLSSMDCWVSKKMDNVYLW